MSRETNEYILKWFEKADHDLMAAQVVIDLRPLILDVACFHCQQAVEKYFKAYLVFKNVDFKKTHDVDLLQVKCVEVDSDFNSIDLKNLNDFGVDIRYPGDMLAPDISEAKEYFLIAERVKEMVREKVELD